MLQCQSCGGTYAATQADGTLYFHRCPPLSVHELAAAVVAGAVVLPKGETPDIAVTSRVYERANLRDENVTGEPGKPNQPAPIKRAGAGVVELPDPAPTPVVVVVPVLSAPAAPAVGA